MKTFTVFVQQANGRGTTHVSSHDAYNSSVAQDMAIDETLADWEEDDADNLRVLGVIAGDVTILKWSDLDE